MKLTIISDIHSDINEKRDYDYSSLSEAEFLIVAGDISGDALRTIKWVDKYVTKGVFVEGNHLGYNEVIWEGLGTKEGSNNFLLSTYESNDNVKFLENTTHEVDGIIFAGCTLYTDFNLFGNPTTAMRHAGPSLRGGGLNDFVYVKYNNKGEKVRLTPRKTVEWHAESVKFLDEVCENNKDKKIVVVTHHCPSGKSIDKEYVGSVLNPAYASNLEWMMEKHDNLKLWCHGHVHHNFDYTIHGTRVVCNPFGYYNELNRPMDNLGLVIDTDTL